MCAYATQRVYKVKQRCRMILNLEEKMRWSLRQARPFQRHYVLREVWDAHRKQANIYVYKADKFFYDRSFCHKQQQQQFSFLKKVK